MPKRPSRVQSQAGIPHVFGTFQDAFHKQRKGRGHEAADLGRLLDVYERWHLRLFPHCDFDTFIARVARLHGKPGGKVATGASLKVSFTQ
jgi:Replication Fork Protection Component Swi3